MSNDLGEKTYFSVISFLYELNIDTCKYLVDEIIHKIGMNKAHEGVVFDYPFDGKGDGFIFIQPIIESFISVDYWDHLKGGYLAVTSCKPFDPTIIQKILKDKEIKIINITFDAVGIN
jgi:hypothetical protein